MKSKMFRRRKPAYKKLAVIDRKTKLEDSTNGIQFFVMRLFKPLINVKSSVKVYTHSREEMRGIAKRIILTETRDLRIINTLYPHLVHKKDSRAWKGVTYIKTKLLLDVSKMKVDPLTGETIKPANAWLTDKSFADFARDYMRERWRRNLARIMELRNKQ